MRDLAVIVATESFVMLKRDKTFDRERYLRQNKNYANRYLVEHLGHEQAQHMSPIAWRQLDAYLERGSL